MYVYGFYRVCKRHVGAIDRTINFEFRIHFFDSECLAHAQHNQQVIERNEKFTKTSSVLLLVLVHQHVRQRWVENAINYGIRLYHNDRKCFECASVVRLVRKYLLQTSKVLLRPKTVGKKTIFSIGFQEENRIKVHLFRGIASLTMIRSWTNFIYFSVRHSDQTHPSAHPPCFELLTANIIVCIPIINGKMIIWLRWALLINSSANQFKWIFSIEKDNDLVFNENQTNPKYQSSFPLHCVFFLHCIDGGRTIGNRKMHRLLFDTDEVDHVK